MIVTCRKDSFVTHRAFCDALAEESARILSASNVPILLAPSPTTTPPRPPEPNPNLNPTNSGQPYPFSLLSPPNFSAHQEDPQHHFHNPPIHISLDPWDPHSLNPTNPNLNNIKPETIDISSPFLFYQEQPPPPPPASSSYKNFMTSPFQGLHVSTPPSASSAHLSATALLQKAATVGAQSASHVPSAMSGVDMGGLGHVTAGMSPEYLGNFATWQQRSDRGLTRDFLGLTGGGGGGGGGDRGNVHNNNVDVNVNVNVNVRNLLSFTGSVEFPTYDRDHSLLRTRVGFGTETPGSETWGHC